MANSHFQFALNELLSCSIAAGLLVTAWSNVAVAAEPDNVAVINRFIEQLASYDQLSADESADLQQFLGELRDDEYARSAGITEGLVEVYPDFGDALDKLAEDDPQTASDMLTKMADSKDQFLAAEATFFLGRAAMFDQEFEAAIPYLEKVLIEHTDSTVQNGNALYFIGIAQANMLENKKAIKSLDKFLTDYPSAPERMRISAMRQTQLLTSIEEGSMLDVYQRMNFSHTRLHTAKTGDVTQAQQDKVVKMLEKMIKEQEKEESKNSKNCKGGDCDKPGEADKPGQGDKPGKGKGQTGKGSQNPDGVVRRNFSDGPASAWSELRERQRDAAFSSIKEKFPARYQGMVEQYFKSFQTDTPQ